MEQQESKSILNNGDAQLHHDHEELLFVDASDSFASDSNPSSISDLDDINITNNVSSSIQSKRTPVPSPSSSSTDLCRRRLASRRSSVESTMSHSFRNKTDGFVDFDRHGCTMKDSEKSKGKLNSTRFRMSSSSARKLLNEETNGNSSITSVIDGGRINHLSITADSPNSGSNLLFALVGLVIKVIGFQINLLISFVTFPLWLMHSSYMFVIDPFRIMRRAKLYMLRHIARIWGFCYHCVKGIIYIWIRKHESTWKFCLRIGWGLLWSAYVGLVLIGLLAFAFVLSGIILKCILEEPIQMTEELNFDYTRGSPTAFVPVMSCPEVSFLESGESGKQITDVCAADSRVIPRYHKVHATVSLTLPESYYNRNLGVFQVRIDFLSSSGNPLLSTRLPCMLRFKSQPIRLLLTFLNLVPIITGYSSESQTLNIKFKGYTERKVPTACLRVMMEQRAEFTRGGGVPEIYSASLKLETEPPLLKRILWYWKGTIFVWGSFMMFMVELLLVLLCCTPLIVPWLRPTGVLSNNNVSRNIVIHAGPK